ncbi:MAG TPA: four helix bundle protein [Chloroflexota bacterium]|nr:four helix bundle protein [Chloroflexota bacterium]
MREAAVGAGSQEPGAGKIESFRDLRVWQAGMDLVEDVYRTTEEFPVSATYGLTSQMRRAAVSIPSNIAEGHSRESTREYLQHLSVAQGSLAELETQLELALRLRYLATKTANDHTLQIHSLGRQLFRLRDAISRKLKPAPGSRPLAPDAKALC